MDWKQQRQLVRQIHHALEGMEFHVPEDDRVWGSYVSQVSGQGKKTVVFITGEVKWGLPTPESRMRFIDIHPDGLSEASEVSVSAFLARAEAQKPLTTALRPVLEAAETAVKRLRDLANV